MPIRDFFRGIMGLPSRTSDENNNRDVWANDLFHDFFRDFSSLMDETSRSDGGVPPVVVFEQDDEVDSSQNDFGFPMFQEPHDMIRHFEEQFRRTFQHLGFIDFPPVGPGFHLPAMESPLDGTEGLQLSPSDGVSLRDRMLKSDSEASASRRDSDLDDRVSDGDLSALLDSTPGLSGRGSRGAPPLLPEHDWRQQLPVLESPQMRSYSSSVTVSTFQGPEGLEERRVVRLPDGSTEERVTRRVGDRQQVHISRRRPDGSTEHEQRSDGLQPGDGAEEQWHPAGRSEDSLDLNRRGLGNDFWKNLFNW